VRETRLACRRDIGISEENVYTTRKTRRLRFAVTGACYYGVARCALFFSRNFPGIGVSSAGRVGTVNLERTVARRRTLGVASLARSKLRCFTLLASRSFAAASNLTNHNYYLDRFTEFENFARSFSHYDLLKNIKCRKLS